MSVGSVFVDIIPRVMGMSAAMTRDVVAPAEQGGTEAGRTFSTAFTRSVTSGTSATTAAVQSQVRAAQAAVEQSSVAISAARDKELAAADRVRIAETKLAEARAKYAADSSAVVAAEARLEAAKRGEVTASERLVLAESNEGRAKTELIARNDALATSNARAGESSAAGSSKALGLVGSLGKLAIGTTAVSAILGGDALHQAGNYQQSLTKLATTAGESTGNLKLVGDGMLNMAGQVGVSAQDLAKGMYVVESSGQHGAQALDTLKASAEGAKQENADLGHVTDAVSTIMHDYGPKVGDAATVTSKLITAVSFGKTNFDEFTGALHSVTPLAAAAGISLADVTGSLSAMTASGEPAQQSAQNLGHAIQSLSAPTQPMIKEMAALGLNAIDLSHNLGKTGVAGTLQEVAHAIMVKMGPAGTVLLSNFNESKLAVTAASNAFGALPPAAQKVAEAIDKGTMSFAEFRKTGGGLDVEQKTQLGQWNTLHDKAIGFSAALRTGANQNQNFTEAMKRATGTADGMNVALQLTGEHTDTVNASIKAISESTKQADGNIKGWSEVQGNFNQQLAEVVDGLKSWVIELGQKLLPKATEFLGWLQSAAHWMGDHANLMKTIGEVILGAAAALMIYKTAMGAAEIATTAWKFALRAAAVAQGELNISELANPIGLIVVAIAGLVAGLIYAYTHFDTFRGIVDSTWKVVETAAGWIWEHGLKPAFEALKVGLGFVIDHWKIFTGVLAVITGPVGIAVAAIVLVATHFTQLKNIAMDVANWFAGPFVNFFVTGFNDVKNIVTTVVGTIVDFLADRWNSMVGTVTNAWNTVYRVIMGFLQPIVDAIRSHWDEIKQITQFVWDMIVSNFTLVWQVIKGIFETALAVVAGVVSIAWGVIKGIFEAALAAVVVVVSMAWENLQVVTKLVWSEISAFFSIIWGVIKAVFDVALPLITGILDIAWNGIKTAIQVVWDVILGILKIAWDLIVGALKIFRDIFIGIVSVFLDVVTGHWSQAWDDIKKFVVNIWHDMTGEIGSVAHDFAGMLSGVFSDLATGLEHIWTAIWDTAKSVFLGGINGVLDLVNGFLGAINTVAGAVGLNINLHVPKIGESAPAPPPPLASSGLRTGSSTAGLATGGPVHGPGTGTSDEVPLWGSNGEHMWTAREVAAAGGHGAMEAMRRNTLQGIPMRYFAAGGSVELPRLAGGGAVTWPAMLSVIKGQFPDALDNSDFRPGDPGYHGRGQALDVGFAGDDNAKLIDASQWIASKYGGETAELIHKTGRNIKNGADVGDGYGLYGASTMDAHLNHTHWAMDHDPGGGGKGLLDTIGGAFSSAVSAIRHLAAGALDTAWPKMPVSQNMLGLLPASANKLRDGVISFVNGQDQARGGGSPAGPGGAAPAGQINDWIGQALGILGYPLSYAGGLYQQAMTESSGNPRAIQGNIGDVNNASGDLAKGIMQVISTTFEFWKLPGHDDIFNPVDNFIAGSRYANNRYGAGWFDPGPQHSHGYDDGGWMMPNTAGFNYSAKPEPVFSSSQWEVLRANLNTGGGGGKDVTINVHSQPGQSGEQIALEVKRQLLFEMR